MFKFTDIDGTPLAAGDKVVDFCGDVFVVKAINVAARTGVALSLTLPHPAYGDSVTRAGSWSRVVVRRLECRDR